MKLKLLLNINNYNVVPSSCIDVTKHKLEFTHFQVFFLVFFRKHFQKPKSYNLTV